MNEFKNPALVIANGEFPYHKSALAPLKENWKIICIDGAADKLKSLGKEPDIVIGDFDSTKVQKIERTNLWIETPNQNKTDLEKTFEWCVKNQIKEVVLLGAGGQREDHLLGNLFLVSKFYNELNIGSAKPTIEEMDGTSGLARLGFSAYQKVGRVCGFP